MNGTTESAIMTVKGLTRRFDGSAYSTGIFDISFNLGRGEVLCLVGPSGAGKTTLLRCLADLEPRDSGDIIIQGDVITKSQHHDTSFVSQDFNLWPHKTILENITLAPLLNKKMQKAEATVLADSLLKRFGLYDKRDSYPDFLSGGQRQRAAIIRALAMKPKILLLDEITSALDPELVSGVLNLIKILAKEGQSMIIATHHLKFASEIADKIIFLEQGRIIQEEITRDFIYAQKNERISNFLKTLSLSRQEINVYEGFDQFQAFQMGTLKRFKPGTVKYVVGSSGDRWFEAMGSYYKDYEKLRVAKQISWRMIMYNESPLDRDVRLRLPQLNEYRLLPKNLENPANYYVMGDIVVIQIFGQPGDQPTIVEIKNPSVVRSYQNYFNLLWEQSSEIK